MHEAKKALLKERGVSPQTFPRRAPRGWSHLREWKQGWLCCCCQPDRNGGLQASLLGPLCSCHRKGAGFPANWMLESIGEPSQFSLGVQLRKKEKGEGLRGEESPVSLSLPDRRRKWQPTPVSLPGKSHGQRSLVYCSPWGHKESGTTEQLTLTLNMFIIMQHEC